MYRESLNRGSTTVETAFLLPIILGIAFVLFFLPVRLYQKAAVYAYAFDCCLERVDDYEGYKALEECVVAGQKVSCERTVSREDISVKVTAGRKDMELKVNKSKEGKLIWMKS